MNDMLKSLGMLPPEKVCGTCRSMVEGATDPTSIGVERYECRRFPPQMVMIAPRQVNVMYPLIDPQMPGCGEHKAKIAVNS